MWSTIEVFTKQFYLDQFYSKKKETTTQEFTLLVVD